MTEFKVGDRVICIDAGEIGQIASQQSNLTVGRDYEVTELDDAYKKGMWVRDDTGLSSWYFSKRFEKVSYAAPATVEVLY